MKAYLQIYLLAGAMATSVLTAQQVATIYDWQFNEAAGTGVFADVTNDGIGTNSFGDWQSYTTDGSGNWQIGDSTGQANKFSSIFMFYGEGVTINGTWEISVSVTAWEFGNSATDNSQLIFGFTDSGGTHHQAKFTNNANAIKLIDGTTLVANFKAGSESSTNFTSDGIPNDAGGTPIEGAPVLGAMDTINMKYTADLDAGTYDFSYSVNNGEFFSIASGTYTGDIQKLRLATQNMTEAEDYMFVDYITVSGTGDFPIAPASPWADVYPLVQGVARDTGIGWISDLQYPFVYHINGVTWLYIVPDGASLDSMFGYSYAGGYWFWTSDNYGSWHFNYNIADWQSWVP